MHLNTQFRSLTLLVLTLFIFFSLNLNSAYAQPAPWPLKIMIEQNEYYLGEDGAVRMNITNYACSDRVDKKEILAWSNQARSVTDPYVKRAEEMVSEGRILSYVLEATDQYVIGDMEYGNYKLGLFGVCVGEPIEIQSVAIWFSWKGFGRALISTVEKRAELAAFDAARYVVDGRHTESSIVVEMVFPFPSTLPPELVPKGSVVPNIEVTLRLPTGTVWTFDRGFKVSGGLTIIPSRTFKLRIMDNAGETPVPSGILRIQALIHTYYLREYVFSEGEEILIERLPDEYDYLVTVLYNSTYGGTEEVYHAIMNSYELAKSGALKTSLYNLRIVPLDLLGRRLDGALVHLNQVGSTSKDGAAVFPLVPTGNYTVRVDWMGERVLERWIWVGYHSTLNPTGVVPDEITLAAMVGDLVVQASDAEGIPIGAHFTVNGPGIKDFEKYQSDGLLVLHQLPVVEYQVFVKNYSKIVDREVSATASLKPGTGEVSLVKLPIHKVDLKVLTIDKKPITGAAVKIGNLATTTGPSGEANLGAIPAGKYNLAITLGEEKIFEDSIIIEKSGIIEIFSKACSLRIVFRDIGGEPQPVYWVLAGPRREYRGYGDTMETPPIPDEHYKLSITLWQDAPAILEKDLKPSEMIDGELLIPVSRMRISAKWSFGEPILEGYVEIRSEAYNLTRRLVMTTQVAETSEKLPLSEYLIKLYLPSGLMLASEKREFNGGVIELTVPSRTITVSVRDFFGQAIPGASVEAYYGNYFIDKQASGPEGSAVIRRVPLYLAGQIRISASIHELRTERYVPIEQSQTTLTIEAVKIGAALIPLSEFIRYIIIIMALLMIYPSIMIAKKLMKRKEKGSQTSQAVDLINLQLR